MWMFKARWRVSLQTSWAAVACSFNVACARAITVLLLLLLLLLLAVTLYRRIP